MRGVRSHDCPVPRPTAWVCTYISGIPAQHPLVWNVVAYVVVQALHMHVYTKSAHTYTIADMSPTHGAHLWAYIIVVLLLGDRHRWWHVYVLIWVAKWTNQGK